MKSKDTGELYYLKVVYCSNCSEERLRLFRSYIETITNNHLNSLIQYKLINETQEAFYFIIPQMKLSLKKYLTEDYHNIDTGKVILKICEGCKEINEMGIVNGNIKPSNIFIIEEEDNVLCLFSDYCINGIRDKSNVGVTIRNIDYLSPQVLNNEEIDIQDDEWSVYVIIYELIIKRNPFGKTLIEKMQNISKCEIDKDFKDFRKYYNEELFDKMFVKDKIKRMKIDETISTIKRIISEDKKYLPMNSNPSSPILPPQSEYEYRNKENILISEIEFIINRNLPLIEINQETNIRRTANTVLDFYLNERIVDNYKLKELCSLSNYDFKNEWKKRLIDV